MIFLALFTAMQKKWHSYVIVRLALWATLGGLAGWAGCDHRPQAGAKKDNALGSGPAAPAVPQLNPSNPWAEENKVSSTRPAGNSEKSSNSAPAATRTASAAPPWLPLADAVPGEWAEYQTREGQQLRYEVVSTAPSGVKTRMTFRQAGRTWGEPALCEDEPQSDPLAREAERRHAETRATKEAVQAAGRTWQATLHEERWIDEDIHYVRRTWVHPEVPYLGIIRMELYGDGQLEARLVLTGYGRESNKNP